MSNFLVVGKRSVGLGQAMLARGDSYILLQPEGHSLEDPRARQIIKANLSSRRELSELIPELAGRIDGVLVVFEEFVEPAAYLAQRLGLPGNPPAAAEISTDKLLMRQKLAGVAEKISPDFAAVNSLADLTKFASLHDFPLVLKPANLVKSLLVTKSRDMAELKANYQKTQATINSFYEKYAPSRTPKIVVEEFLAGSQHSVAAFADTEGRVIDAGELVDITTAAEKGFNDSFLYSRNLPSKLPTQLSAEITQVAKLGIDALGLRSCPIHAEVMLTPAGPMIIEIAARIGGYRQRMYQLARGLDLAGATLDTALGRKINLKAARNEACTAVELFPKRAGTFKELKGQSQLLKLPSLAHFSLKYQPGQAAGPSSAGYKAAAVIILHSQSASQLDQDLEFIDEQVAVVTV